jgi:hypothetical protein
VFTDNIDNTVGPYVQRNYYKGWYDELFYWTPDFPELPIKQAHVLNNFIKHCEDRNLFESINEERFQPNGFSNRFDMHLKDPYVKTVLYPKWSNDIFCNGKTASFTYSIRDSWFLKGNLDATARYMQISDSYFKHVDSENKTRRSIRPQFSQRYWIE